MKTTIKSAIVLFAIVLTILSCSKKDDAPSTSSESLDYTVDCIYKIGTTQYAGRASYLFIPIDSAPDRCDKSSFQITRAGSDDLINIVSLKQNGGIFDSPMRTADTKCNKMGMEINAIFGGELKRYASVNATDNTLTLSGKTYTATCKVYADNYNLSSNSVIISATWTKP
jgi:hypothetical protein